MAEKMGLPQIALQQMVSRTALNNEAAKLGLATSDAAVAQNVRAMAPFRGTLGQFDRLAFMQAIQTAGYSEDQFLGEVRQDMTRNQLTEAVEANFLVPSTYAQAIFQYINEKRAADYVVLSPAQAGDVAAPSDTVLADYVKAHAARYSTPEYRQVDYAAIAPADVAGSVSVTDAQIQQAYDARKSTYIVAEKRDVQQIEFKTQAEAQAARAKIQSGTSFEDIAAQRGLKPDQTSLGTLAEDELPDAERAKAIFALPLNQVSQPIKTGFGGYVLARVTKIAPGSTRTLADVKEEIRKDLADQLTASKLVDVVNAYTDARSAGDELAEAAKKAGMKVAHLAAVDPSGMTPAGTHADVPADPEFLPALFKAEVGEDTDPFATKLGAYYALQVNGVTPPKLKPMDQVRAQALSDWTSEQRDKLLAAKAKALAAQAAKDEVAGRHRQGTESDGAAQPRSDARNQRRPILRRTGDQAVCRAGRRGGIRPPGPVRQYCDRPRQRHQLSGLESARIPLSGPAWRVFPRRWRSDFTLALANAARAQSGREHQSEIWSPPSPAPASDRAMIEPAFDAFTAGYEAGRAQLVYTRLVADMETPVSAYLKLGFTADGTARDNAFLLESVQGGEARGRYSIIGLKPDLIWRCRDGKAEINRAALADANRFAPETARPLESLRALIARNAHGPCRRACRPWPPACSAIWATTWCGRSRICPIRRPIRWACPTPSCCGPPSSRSSTA